MEHYTIIHLELNDLCSLWLIALVLIYNLVLIQLAPFIKKFFGKIYGKIKKKRPVGFPIKQGK